MSSLGLPKIHKTNVPLWPILNSIGTPTYNIAKHLVNLLQSLIGQTTAFVKVSTEYVVKMDNITVDVNDILVNFAVVSLFTMVPVGEILEELSEIFTEDITNFA